MTGPSTIRSRLLPSLSGCIFSTTLVLLFVLGQGGNGLLRDSDTGWHIRTGQWILEHRAVPQQDLFSFSKPGGRWFAWEWLSDVLFALLDRYAGLAGLVLVSALVIALLCSALYRFSVERGADAVVAVAVTFAAYYASSIHWLARPHIFGWALALAFYIVLERSRAGGRAVFWLVPLAALWANLHASFVLGLLLVAVYGIGELLQAAFAAGESAPEVRRRALHNVSRYGLVLAACGAATLLNPYGARVHLHIWEYLKNQYIFDHITEFSSPNFHAPAVRFFEFLVMAGIASALWMLRRGRFAPSLLVFGLAHASLESARYIPLYAIFAAPVIAEALTAGCLAAHRSAALPGWARRRLAGLQRFGADIGRIDAQPHLPAVSMLAIALVAVGLFAPAPVKGFPSGFSRKLFPAAAADFLERGGPAGNVLSTDQWSSYLIYRAFPRVRVFMDGRSDYYGSELGELYLNLMSANHSWRETLEQYRVDAVVLPVDCALVGAMKESAEWKVTYDDGLAIVFHRADARTSELLAAAHGVGTAEIRP